MKKGEPMKNKLIDLNNHLFAQLERLSDESKRGDKLTEEIERSRAVCGIARNIIDNGKLALDAQKALAVGAGFGPVNRTVTLDEKERAGLPYGPEEIGKLLTMDWTAINENREAWNKRWSREIER